MALDPNRFTRKTQEALGAAQARPRDTGNTEVSSLHLFARAPRPARRCRHRRDRTDRCRSRRAAAAGRRSARAPAAREWRDGARRAARVRNFRLLEEADKERAQLDDEYLSTEHVLLAMTDVHRWCRRPVARHGHHPRRRARRAAAGARLAPRHERQPRRAVPGAREVRPRPHRGRRAPARSTRSSAATKRSAGSSRCCRAARRTTPCSSVSRVSARPRSSKASRAASSRATCPRGCATSA